MSFVSFLHSVSTCSSQLGSSASVCVAVPATGMQNISTFQFSRYSFRAVQFFLCSNSDLWIKTCFFLLPLLTAIFQVAPEVPPPQELTTMGAQGWKLWVPDLLPGWNETNRLDSVCQQCFYQGCEAGNVKKNAGSPTFTLKAMHCLWKAWLVAWEI